MLKTSSTRRVRSSTSTNSSPGAWPKVRTCGQPLARPFAIDRLLHIPANRRTPAHCPRSLGAHRTSQCSQRSINLAAKTRSSWRACSPCCSRLTLPKEPQPSRRSATLFLRKFKSCSGVGDVDLHGVRAMSSARGSRLSVLGIT